ncbi:MAG: hypothetical protein AB3N18_07680 [Allomuricauda sp.]
MEEVNYIKHLNGVFVQFTKDNRLNPTHISLYVALFQIWNEYHFTDSFYINRSEVMELSKIGSKSTYHRCIKELSHWGYLLYSPSNNPFKGSRIKMFDFGTTDKPLLYPSRNDFGTTGEQVLVSKTKHKQTIKNNTNINKQKNLVFENSNLENGENQLASVPYQDNLKTVSDKNYDDPL